MDDSILMVLKLLLSAALGGFVGYEREIHEHPAGLRTHILVCMGATLITLVSISFSPATSDPARIAAQIVSGIGFLGAGTILRQGNIVRGLTTAASLWTVAGIGMAVAVGGVFALLAVVATGIVFVTLSTMRGLEPPRGRSSVRNLYVEVPVDELQMLGTLTQKLTDIGVSVDCINSLDTDDRNRRSFRLKLILTEESKTGEIVRLLTEQVGLDRFEWT